MTARGDKFRAMAVAYRGRAQRSRDRAEELTEQSERYVAEAESARRWAEGWGERAANCDRLAAEEEARGREKEGR